MELVVTPNDAEDDDAFYKSLGFDILETEIFQTHEEEEEFIDGNCMNFDDFKEPEAK